MSAHQNRARLTRLRRTVERGVQARATLIPWQLFRLRYGLPVVSLSKLVDTDIPISEPILDDACMAPFIAGLKHDDFTPLMQVARVRQPRVILELGTAYGNLTANLAQNCPTATIYTVNAPVDEQTGVLTTFSLSREDVGRVYRQHGYTDRIVQIFCNTLSLDLSSYFSAPAIDLAIIDACHDAEYVINDFHKVRRFVRPNGVVFFHDTHPSMRQHLRGSYIGCMKLRQEGFDIRHLSGTWWAVWKRRWSNAGTAAPVSVS